MSGQIGARQRLAALLARRFFVRFHLSLILAVAFATGILTTKGFLALGLETMHWRWPIALAAAYLAFLLCVRIWLSYIGLGRYLDDGRSPDVDLPDLSFSGGGGSSGGGGVVGDLGDATGIVRGGEFGGGGASGDFALPVADSGSGGGGSSSLSLPDIDLGGDDGWFVVLVILALVAAIFGAGIYMIWQAPTLLADAAFEAALAAGMIKPVRRIKDPGWVGGAVRASWGPFLAIFVCAMLIAGLAEHFAPEARTLLEAIHILLQ